MSTKKEDKLKKLLKSVGPNQAADVFTREVMDIIEVESRPEIGKNGALEVLLRRSQVQKPTEAFTSLVMDGVSKLEKGHVYESILDETILPKKVWYVLAMVSIFMIISIIFSGHSSQTPTGFMTYLVGMGSSLNTLIANVREIPSLYLLTLIACSVLIGLDYMLRTTRLARGLKHSL